MNAKLLVLGLATLCLSTAPALADLAVVVDSSQTMTTITGKTSVNDLTAVVSALNPASDMTVKIQDTVTHATLDGVKLAIYGMDLSFHFLGAGDAYTANGVFKLQDAVGVNWDLQADFTSTNVALVPIGSDYRLEVQGTFSPMSGNPSILMDSDPWVFKGDMHDGGPGNADGNLLTITVNGPGGYDVGGLVALHYPVYGKFSSLQDLFASLGEGSVLDNGSVHAQVVVPVPAALLLGMLGMGVTGLKLRKYA
jgi:hypothetical protein